MKAVVLHLKYIKNNASLSDVIDFLSRTTFDEDIKEILGIITDEDGNDEITENTFEHVQDDTFLKIYGTNQKLHPIVERFLGNIIEHQAKQGEVLWQLLNLS